MCYAFQIQSELYAKTSRHFIRKVFNPQNTNFKHQLDLYVNLA